MEHIMPKRASLLMKITFVAALSALFISKPVSASGVTTFHTETNVETKERMKKRDKKAKKTRVVKKKEYDSYTKTYPGAINTVSVNVNKKTVKKKYLKKGKKKVHIVVKTITKTTTKTESVLSERKYYSLSELKGILPFNIYQAFIDRKFTFMLVDPGDLGSASGYFSAKKRCIQVVNGRNTLSTILHEFGHFVSYASGNTCSLPDFLKIYQSEKALYNGGTYGRSSASEYFAESFKEYIANPTVLKQSRPKTYEAVKAAVERIG